MCDGISQRDIGAGDGGGAGTAISLEDVAVELDGVLTQLAQVHGGAQGAADETGNFMRTALDLALHGLARHALVRCGRQHGVLGSKPAFAGVLLKARDAKLDGRGAHDAGVAELDEDGACRVGREIAGDANRAQLIERAAIEANEIRHGL